MGQQLKKSEWSPNSVLLEVQNSHSLALYPAITEVELEADFELTKGVP